MFIALVFIILLCLTTGNNSCKVNLTKECKDGSKILDENDIYVDNPNFEKASTNME